ncbi:MAG: hypothetical protein AB7K24_02815, partial [Gemmataceae bacterium]
MKSFYPKTPCGSATLLGVTYQGSDPEREPAIDNPVSGVETLSVGRLFIDNLRRWGMQRREFLQATGA